VLVGAVALALERRRPRVAFIAALVVYVGIAIYLVAKPPFPAKACLADGGAVAGVLIGESDSRTYLGDLSSAHPRRMLTLPAGRIQALVVGGKEAAITGATCP
jgi:hypothetical protein